MNSDFKFGLDYLNIGKCISNHEKIRKISSDPKVMSNILIGMQNVLSEIMITTIMNQIAIYIGGEEMSFSKVTEEREIDSFKDLIRTKIPDLYSNISSIGYITAVNRFLIGPQTKFILIEVREPNTPNLFVFPAMVSEIYDLDDEAAGITIMSNIISTVFYNMSTIIDIYADIAITFNDSLLGGK